VTKYTARAWVQKLDTYYKLNQMTETEAISFATLHLENEAHEWWYHGLVTLGHSRITSYRGFTDRLMDRFDKKDPEIHFRDLALLRQTCIAKAFITEFQRVVMAVTDISEPRLIMLFTEGLTEPLRGWVKAYRPLPLYRMPSFAFEIWQTQCQRLKLSPNHLCPRGIETGSHSRENGRARRSWMMRIGESL
jgi:hypothetical protein